MTEFFNAYEGWCIVNGVKKRSNAPSKEELASLKEYVSKHYGTVRAPRGRSRP